MKQIMSSNNHDGDGEPHSLGYEDDISDQASEVSTITTTSASCSDPTIEDCNESLESDTGTIWVGCDVRDAGPGVENDDEAEFGIIWIGCSIQDMGFDSYQAFLNSDDQEEAEHIENVGVLGDAEDSEITTINSSSKESKTCKQQSK